MIFIIKIETIDKNEALRYMGFKGTTPDEKMLFLINECERELLKVINPRYTYKIFDIELHNNTVEVKGTNMKMDSSDIFKHLNGCEKSVFFAATISENADSLIRSAQISDMTKALIFDCLSNVAIEQVCDKIEEIIKADYPEYFQTWRFSPGYGDLSIETQKDFIKVLDATKKAGICLTDSFILTPKKSVTAIIGLSTKEIERKNRGCQSCNMKDTCNFRKGGNHCGF